MDFAFSIDFVKDKIFDKARQQVMKMSGGLYPAPLKVNSVKNYKRKTQTHNSYFIKDH